MPDSDRPRDGEPARGGARGETARSRRSFDPAPGEYESSRRAVLEASATLAAGSVLGFAGTAGAQDDDVPVYEGLTTPQEFRPGTVFRVQSPPVENTPYVDPGAPLPDYEVRLIQYFNARDEGYLWVRTDAPISQGELYVFADRPGPSPDLEGGVDLVWAEFRPLRQADFPFELGDDTDVDLLEGGGEGVVRPANFYAGALFRITSGPQGWLPEDVRDAGWFTDYDAHHARYLGTDEQFLFYPQETASVEQGQLYVLRDEFEIVRPFGRLVTAAFVPVDEESLVVDDDFL